MEDGGRVAESGGSAGHCVPCVVAADLAGGAGLLAIALLAYLKGSLLRLLQIAAWLLRGREHLERKLVEAGVASGLSLSPRLAGLLDRLRAQGRPVYLASHKCSPLLEALAARHAATAGVVVVRRGAGSRRGAAELLDRFPDGYDAVMGGRGAITVARHPSSGALMGGLSPDLPDLGVGADASRVSVLRELAQSLRLHQSVKNVLVFVPLVLSGRFTVLPEVRETLLAFIALTLVACGTYILNDIWDVADDRAHWSKKERPIASGRLSAATALGLALLLIPAGVALAATISWATCSVLLLYLALTLAYSLRVKTVPFLDGFTLAALFTIRLGLGVVAADAPPSPWLFVFSMFLFSSLSYAKRYTEISRAMARNASGPGGRGYRPVDAPMVLTVGLAAGVGAVLIMVLYIVEEAFRSSFYGTTAALWGFPPLVFLFIIRIWLVSVRGEMMDDPVAFAIKDKASIGLLGLLLVCFAIAWLG